jgi:hypothetical protein
VLYDYTGQVVSTIKWLSLFLIIVQVCKTKLRKPFLVEGTTSTLDPMRVETRESPMGRNDRFPRLCFSIRCVAIVRIPRRPDVHARGCADSGRRPLAGKPQSHRDQRAPVATPRWVSSACRTRRELEERGCPRPLLAVLEGRRSSHAALPSRNRKHRQGSCL